MSLIARVRGRRAVEGDFARGSWLFHHADLDRFPAIVRQGLRGGDGRNWNDPVLVRRSQGRVYFSHDPDTWAYGSAVLLRVRPEDIECAYDGQWALVERDGEWVQQMTDCFVDGDVPPEVLQVFDWRQEAWVPLLVARGRERDWVPTWMRRLCASSAESAAAPPDE